MVKLKQIRHTPLLWILLFIGLAVRLIMAPIWTGYDADIQTFIAWSEQAYSVGLPHLYGSDMFLDYPPGYMYVLYIIAAIRNLLHIGFDSSGMLILLKLPSMIADVITGYLIYRVAGKYVKPLFAVGMAALYVLNPAILINSTIWGQVDSFFMVVIGIYLLVLQRGKMPLAAVILAIGILLKPQGLLFGPFLLIAVLQKRDFRVLWQSVLAGVATVLVLLLPFGILSNGVGWVFKLYFTTLASYPYGSLNAFNFIALLGGNFTPLDGNFISYQAWGIMLMLVSAIYSLYLYYKSIDKKGAVFYFAFLFLAAAFMFTVKMHERYLFYALLPLLMSYIYLRDRRILGLFVVFSFSHFVNIAYVLKLLWQGTPWVPQWDVLMLIISGLQVILLIYGAWLGWQLFNPLRHGGNARLQTKTNRKDNKNMSKFALPNMNMESNRTKLFTKKDWLLSMAITLIYSVFAFINLGANEAPESYWKPATAGEAVIFDLGSNVHVERLHTYAGVGHGKYTYSYLYDGQNWSEPTEVDSNHTKVFTWNVLTPKVETRYIKLDVKEQGFTLHEIAFFDGKSDKPLPVAHMEGINLNGNDQGKLDNLIDEASIVPYSPTYMNGTYFDEIYHARTAYEHLHQIEPYENTHPPLGKIFIAIGIAIFGMNPFGWRIVGTLFGIAMVPIMYMFGKRLFGKTRYGFISSFLFAFDFMHFAQTRISTIDVYGVFFIILMFYFMYRYWTSNFYRDGLRKTLVPLGLAGLFFGIGAASKWIVIYGGIGLAVILLIVLIERYVEHRQAKRMLQNLKNDESISTEDDADPSVTLTTEERSYLEKVASTYWKPTISTLAWCLLFYVVIPVAIYVMSYIPFMMVPGAGHGLKDVVTYQEHMFNYHSKLVATHPFGSPWYEWPFMVTPIWYYAGKFLPEGMLSSIVSFGNPLVWWGGFLALIAAIYCAIKYKQRQIILLLIACASQYLPWVGVPRLTFIYHYFALVPFLCLLLAYYLGNWMKKSKEMKWIVWGYLAAAFLLFLMFYPILSGMVVPASYTATWLRWLPTWNFF
ncbi:glycosyltransferase family 39 protein [Paenibacillus albiflavus]|uniref:glycosyltransferase family 39 protein n=1 Tax=Paenibacillus albiflavus TaxID=2545760 RepID=UPI001047FA71|nr:glycosyltransferase family 39 protein [Paenibacillus albiflavus]